MSPLAAMKADAKRCNNRFRRVWGSENHGPPTPNRRASKQVSERRQAVKDMREQGMKLCDIAKVLGVNYATIQYDAYAIRRGA
ncbi:hypothetical protein Q5Y75_05820 [Ruegeria sp. 2205SS24-7]|uniref:hypothetical protein n=1 Tax=Ruegeria discodermiae TaxID=3064389 RepID=UPI00274203C1|nr:hypothetical protein [Ruegeria sp. 2205SS24-7]MDP5216729.1 hypothetical protein [Ruegeria sp. 2205SS24-7]